MSTDLVFFLFFFYDRPSIALRKPYPESLQLGSFHWFIGYAGPVERRVFSSVLEYIFGGMFMDSKSSNVRFIVD